METRTKWSLLPRRAASSCGVSRTAGVEVRLVGRVVPIAFDLLENISKFQKV